MFRILLVVCIGCTANCARTEDERFSLTAVEGYETVARLETTQGEITIRLYSDRAPGHAANFANLCGTGFYDGIYFHRVAPEFLIQGGDPNTRDEDVSNDGLGGHTYAGPQTTLRLEPQEDLTCFRGAVAMARTEEENSAGSQFFIFLSETAHLDGQYTVFGEVIEGIEVADKIAEEPGEPVAELGGFNPARPQYIEVCTLEEVPETQHPGDGSKNAQGE